MLDSIEYSSTNGLHIFDARPWINAEVNRFNGGGYEHARSNNTLTFCRIDNIHNVRDSYNAMLKIKNLDYT